MLRGQVQRIVTAIHRGNSGIGRAVVLTHDAERQSISPGAFPAELRRDRRHGTSPRPAILGIHAPGLETGNKTCLERRVR